MLLFSFDKDIDRDLKELFKNRKITKKYQAIVRGWTADTESIDYPLKNESGKIQEAVTEYKTLQRFELPIALGLHNTSRYSLVDVCPQTGRMHQIRKHFAHINHPIIGDRPYGCNKQNRLFKQKWQMTSMMLHASELEFIHPVENQIIKIKAAPSPEFNRVLQILTSY